MSHFQIVIQIVRTDAKSAYYLRNVCPHVQARIPLEETPLNLILVTHKDLLENPSKVVKIGQKYRAIYIRPKYLCFIVTGNTKTPKETLSSIEMLSDFWSVRPSVRASFNVPARLPIDEFTCNFILGIFIKISWKIPYLFKIGQKSLNRRITIDGTTMTGCTHIAKYSWIFPASV